MDDLERMMNLTAVLSRAHELARDECRRLELRERKRLEKARYRTSRPTTLPTQQERESA